MSIALSLLRSFSAFLPSARIHEGESGQIKAIFSVTKTPNAHRYSCSSLGHGRCASRTGARLLRQSRIGNATGIPAAPSDTEGALHAPAHACSDKTELGTRTGIPAAPSGTEGALHAPAPACSDKAELGTRTGIPAAPSGMEGALHAPAHACSDKAELGTRTGIPAAS